MYPVTTIFVITLSSFILKLFADDENSDAFSEMTSALIDHDPTLDLVDLASTPSISSIEFDGDFL